MTSRTLRRTAAPYRTFGADFPDNSSAGMTISLGQLPPRRCPAGTPPVPEERHDDRAGERADDPTRPERQAVSRQQTDEEPADEGADDAGRKCESPVDTLRRSADDEL